MHAFEKDTPRHRPVALVVGACGGLGLASARRLGQGHEVVLADLDAGRLEAITAELRGEGYAVIPVTCDVTDRTSLEAMAAGIASRGRLRALAHVVGLSSNMSGWRRIIEVNLLGAVATAEIMLPVMKPGGAAVFVSSLGAHMAPNPPSEVLSLLDTPDDPELGAKLVAFLGHEPSAIDAYCWSKLGLMRMCQRLAGLWGRHDARILSLSLGFISSPMSQRGFQNNPQSLAQIQPLVAQTPLGRRGSMLEAVDALEFLCSDRASFISGTDLLVDGGVLAALRHRVP